MWLISINLHGCSNLANQWSNFSMLSFSVSSKIDFSLEGLMAKFTGKRFVSGVFTGMGYQIRRLTKSLSTYLALVWFFACDQRGKENDWLLLLIIWFVYWFFVNVCKINIQTNHFRLKKENEKKKKVINNNDRPNFEPTIQRIFRKAKGIIRIW